MCSHGPCLRVVAAGCGFRRWLCQPGLLLLLTGSAIAFELLPSSAAANVVNGAKIISDATLQQQSAAEALRDESKKLETAAARFREAGDVNAEAESLVQLAAIYQRLTENRRALDCYNRALTLYRAQNIQSGMARALNGIGSTYGRLSDYQKAIQYYSEALILFRAQTNRRGEAAALTGIGSAYVRLNEYQKAREILNQSLPLYRDLGDQSGEASALQQLGYASFSQDDYLIAIEFYNKALALSRAAADRRLEALAIYSIGQAYYHLGDYQKALDLYGEALSLHRAVLDRSAEAAALSAIGRVYRFLGDYQKALNHHSQALAILRSVGERMNEATSLNNSAHVYLSMGEYEKALPLFAESLEICRAVGNRAGEASNTNGIGLAHAGLKEYQKAVDFHRQALELFRVIGHRRAEADSLSHLGRAYLSLAEPLKALSFLNDALALYRTVKVPRQESQTLYDIARTQQAIGDLAEAKAKVEAAIRLTETFRQDVSSQQLRSSFQASVRDYYELNVDTLMQLHKQYPSAGFEATALETSERARARSLLDLLVEARADIRKGVDPELLERERSLRQLVATRAERQTQLLNTRGTPEQLAVVARELEASLTEYQDVQAKIRKSSPRYAALMQPEPLVLRQIQTEVLDEDTALLEYFLGLNRSYLWVVTRQAVTAYELPGSAEIEKLARRFYDLVKSKGKGEELRHSANRLSEILLAPAAEQLSKKRLAIVPDGPLHYVPFAALPKPTRRSEPQSVYQPLVVAHELVTLPSASTIAVLKNELKARALAPNLIAVLADPVFDANDVRVRRGPSHVMEASKHSTSTVKDSALLRSVEQTGVAQGTWPLPRLLGTRREARTILSLAPIKKSRQALDFEASRDTATSLDLGTYQVIHFATHALINNQNPELSGLVLSLVDSQGNPRDGFLRLNDIYNLRLPAELVVLSACQTGLGKEIRGEGLIGLTRGFMYAGAPRLITSLWPVDDKATSELMGRFYRGLLGDNKLSAVAALRDAQIEMWRHKDWQSPYYWAAFTLQGEWK